MGPNHGQLGNILYRARRFEKAITVLRKTLGQGPDFITAHVSLGLCDLARNKYDLTLTEFQAGEGAMQYNPDFAALKKPSRNARHPFAP